MMMDVKEAFKSQVIMTQNYPMDALHRDSSFLLFDENLIQKNHESEAFNAFVQGFENRLALSGGENLKDLQQFPKNLSRLLEKWPEPISRNQKLIILGGGSLGDFGGFVASILKRGVGLIHIPSTWLAAMDSAHGGKTGLNFKGVKNQVGTFYPSEKTYIVRPLLESAPIELKEQAFGELIKMALVGDSQFFKEMMVEKRQATDFLWRFLPHCIEDKYQIVLQDPFEKKEIRQILNFGHTLGHALEVSQGWSHGDAVLQGCFFSLEWSRHKGLLSDSLYQMIIEQISRRFQRTPATHLSWYKPPKAKTIEVLVAKDKKRNQHGELLFIFLKAIGQPVLQRVSLNDLINEAKRQNWVR